MKKLNKVGFSAIETTIIIIVVGLIAGVSWRVIKSHNKKKSAPASQVVTNPAPTPQSSTSAEEKYSNYKSPAESAEVKSEITAAMNLHCQTTFVSKIKGSYPNKTLTATTFSAAGLNFDESASYRRLGNYVQLSATCQSSQIADTERSWSGFVALLRKANGTWQVTTTDQMAPSCEKVDGLGYPTEILSTCYSGETTRQPR